MGETANTTESTPKKNWFKSMKSEFAKIIWPDKESVSKQTVSVIGITIVLGIIIAVLDLIIQYGLDKIL